MNILDFISSTLAATVSAGTAMLIASLGAIINEKSGVSNLGVEGMMIVGAIAGFTAVQATSSLLLGVLAAVLAGAAIALIHSVLCISLKANQVVSGLALTIFGVGLANFIGGKYVGVTRAAGFQEMEIPLLSKIPVLGEAFFSQNLLVYLSILLVILCWFVFTRTRLGMKLRAVGENPGAADAAGIHVNAIRYGATLISGALCGLGGAYLSLAYNSTWVDTITAGQGWIAVALVIFATWKPLRTILGSYLFGFISILGFRLQALGVNVPIAFFSMLPYIATVLVLIVVTGRFGGKDRKVVAAPAALSMPYDREAR